MNHGHLSQKTTSLAVKKVLKVKGIHGLYDTNIRGQVDIVFEMLLGSISFTEGKLSTYSDRAPQCSARFHKTKLLPIEAFCLRKYFHLPYYTGHAF